MKIKVIFSSITLFSFNYAYTVIPSLQSIVQQSIAQQIKKYPKWTAVQKEEFNTRIENKAYSTEIGKVITINIFNLKNQDFRYLNLTGISIPFANLENGNFNGAILHDANLQECVLKNTNFNNADLRGANLTGVNFKETNFKGAKLQKVWLTPTVQLPDYQFPADVIKFYADLKNLEDKKTLNQRISTGCFDLRLQHLEGLDLTGIDFRNCDLTCAFLQQTNLTDATFNNTILKDAKLSRAKLSKKFRLSQNFSDI